VPIASQTRIKKKKYVSNDCSRNVAVGMNLLAPIGYCRDRQPLKFEVARVFTTLPSATGACIDQSFAVTSPVTYAKQVTARTARRHQDFVSQWLFLNPPPRGLFYILTETTERCSVSSCLQSKFNCFACLGILFMNCNAPILRADGHVSSGASSGVPANSLQLTQRGYMIRLVLVSTGHAYD
jgi:hypothetical protein